MSKQKFAPPPTVFKIVVDHPCEADYAFDEKTDKLGEGVQVRGWLVLAAVAKPKGGGARALRCLASSGPAQSWVFICGAVTRQKKETLFFINRCCRVAAEGGSDEGKHTWVVDYGARVPLPRCYDDDAEGRGYGASVPAAASP